jgi:hypothetical protein
VAKGTHRKRRRPAVIELRAVAVASVAVLAAGVYAACSAPAAQPGAAYPQQGRTSHSAAPGNRVKPPAAQTHEPAAAVSVLSASTDSDLSIQFARTLFGSSPVVVVARDAAAEPALASVTRPAGSPSATSANNKPAKPAKPQPNVLPAAARAAAAAHAPLLLAGGVTAKLATAVRALHARAVLAVGLPPAEVAAALPGVRVVTRAAQLPATGPPAGLRGVAVLVPVGVASASASTKTEALSPAVTAVTVTARSAGATVIGMSGWDPRAYPQVIRELASLRPDHVVAVGASFGPTATLGARLTVAETGRQLPGGGQRLFPGRRFVALYGHPGTPGLGVLGHQDLPASIARAQDMAAWYRPLSSVPVIPAFEIIASVAEAAPGPDGSYSALTPVAGLLPWVKQATAAGLYVVLDLQAGRASLLAQAQYYQSLLTLPDVGLALDPEWKLTARQKPLHQIGHVDITEANSVIRWLAALTARYHLPQKLLVLHQFRLDMLPGESALDTSHDDLAIVVHMDGQGTPGQKVATWDAVTAAAPRGVYFGWKDFFVMDHPMLTPQETMSRLPAPVMISYQ